MKIYQKIDRISESLPSPVLFWAKAARSCFSKWSSCSWQHGIAIQLANSWWSLNIIDTYRYYIYIYDICDIINIHEPWGYYWYMYIYIYIYWYHANMMSFETTSTGEAGKAEAYWNLLVSQCSAWWSWMAVASKFLPMLTSRNNSPSNSETWAAWGCPWDHPRNGICAPW